MAYPQPSTYVAYGPNLPHPTNQNNPSISKAQAAPALLKMVNGVQTNSETKAAPEAPIKVKVEKAESEKGESKLDDDDGLKDEATNLLPKDSKIASSIESLKKRLPLSEALKSVKNGESDRSSTDSLENAAAALPPGLFTSVPEKQRPLTLDEINLAPTPASSNTNLSVNIPDRTTQKSPTNFTNLKELFKQEAESDHVQQRLKELGGGPNLQKLYRALRTHIPEPSGERILDAMQVARDRRGGKLSGLSKESIVALIKGILAEPPSENK